MATKTAEIHIMIRPDLKDGAESVFAKAGYTASEAIEQFYAWTLRHNRTPMKIEKKAKIPDLSRMTKEEVNAILDDSEKQIEQGRYITVSEARRRVKEKYGYTV